MGNYIVSARKYRPKGFEEVVGQEHITTTLHNAIANDKLAQALLFCGPRGVGKTTCARIVARMINRFDPDDTNGQQLNIYELDAASNNSVEDIRNLIDQVRYPPQFGSYKVYIIDEVHMLSNQAFNAFLKTLEEPPSYAIFILATTEKHKVIPTILSRCQIYDFNRIQVGDIVEHLKEIARKETIEADEEALHRIALKADGALRDALSVFDLIVTYSKDGKITYEDTIRNLHILDYDYYFRITEYFMAEDHAAALMLFDEVLNNGFDGHNFIVGLGSHFRDLLVCKDEQTLQLMQTSEAVRQKYLNQSRQVDNSFLISALNIINQCDLQYKSSKNHRLHVELALLKLTHLNNALSLADIEPQEVKKKNLKSEPTPEKPAESVPPGDAQSTGTAPAAGEEVGASRRPVAAQKKVRKTQKLPTVQSIRKEIEQGNGNEDLDVEEWMRREDVYTEAELKVQWEAYLAQLKENGKDVEYATLNRRFSLDEDHTITLEFDNGVQSLVLERLQQDLTTFLRRQLKNKHIRIAAVVRKNEVEKKVYTNKEKFEYLAGKYPSLRKLQQKLNLDPEF